MLPLSIKLAYFFTLVGFIELISASNLAAQNVGSMPYLSWQTPSPNQVYQVGEDIKLVLETGTFDPAYLSIENKQTGWVKFKWGYDSKNLWTPPQNVTANGNDTLQIVLKDLKGGIDWSKIRLHPQGNANQPLSLSKYIQAGQPLAKGWIKISIPLADFYAGINFAALSYIEFPYSANAGVFEIGVRQIQFVGGAQPFVWWSDSKHDNIFDGGLAMTGTFVPKKTYTEGIEKVAFLYNDKLLGTDHTYPFGLLWINPAINTYQIKAVVHAKNGIAITSETLSIHVKEDDSTALAAAPRVFPFHLSAILLANYQKILPHLQHAAIAQLPYADKQGRWELRRQKNRLPAPAPPPSDTAQQPSTPPLGLLVSQKIKEEGKMNLD